MQGKIHNLNNATSIKYIEFVLKIFPDKKKISGLDAFTDKLYKVFKNEIILIPKKHFQKINKE